MTNILYIADPASIHDQKWINWFSSKKEYSIYVLVRKIHENHTNPTNLNIVGTLSDYSVSKPWKNKSGKKTLERLIEQYQIQILHIFYAEPNLLWINSIENKLKLLVTCRGSDVLVGIKHFRSMPGFLNKLVYKSYQKAFNKCSNIICTSHAQLNYLNSNFSLTVSQTVIRTGIDLKNIQPAKKTRKKVFFSRNMRPIYRHEMALKAISLLPKNLKDTYQFIFIDNTSSDKDYVLKISSLMAELKDVEIDFLPNLDSQTYFDLLAESKLVVMTPQSDGSPVSAMESIASGCALILPDLDYDKDLFANATFFEQNSEVDLANKIAHELLNINEISTPDVSLFDRELEMQKLEKIYREN